MYHAGGSVDDLPSEEQLLGIDPIMNIPPLRSFADVQTTDAPMELDSFSQPLISSFPLHSSSIYQQSPLQAPTVRVRSLPQHLRSFVV
jgi:hypothetical protein